MLGCQIKYKKNHYSHANLTTIKIFRKPTEDKICRGHRYDKLTLSLITKKKNTKSILLWSLARLKLGDRDRIEADKFTWDPPPMKLVVINGDCEPESKNPLLLLSIVSNESVGSTKRSRSKLSSSTPIPNHRPHGNLI